MSDATRITPRVTTVAIQAGAIEELLCFPGGDGDDRVDATCQALQWRTAGDDFVPCWSCGTLALVAIMLGDHTMCCLCDSCRARLAAELFEVAEIVRSEVRP